MDGNSRLAIEETLSTIFAESIEEGSIGNGFAYVSGGSAVITVADLADSVIRAAAIRGPDHAATTVGRWASAERISYKLYALLTGLSVNEMLGDKDRFRFDMLPRSPDPFVFLPFGSEWSVAHDSVRGNLRVAIACEAGPAFFPPSRRDVALGVGRTWAQGPLPDDFVNDLCKALSLVCNGHVDWVMQWTDCAEVEPFGLSLGSGYGYRSRVSHAESVTMAQSDLDRALELLPRLSQLRGNRRTRGVTLAIDRWVRSKGPRELADRLIDLRIALEALFLGGGDKGEIRFRLATRGAWYLGSDPQERTRIARELRSAYDTASKVIHAGSVAQDSEDWSVLRSAQDLCRKAILRMMDESGGPLDWGDIIMGGSDDNTDARTLEDAP